jgi:hypothetical protein
MRGVSTILARIDSADCELDIISSRRPKAVGHIHHAIELIGLVVMLKGI